MTSRRLRFAPVLLAAALVSLALTACGGAEAPSQTGAATPKPAAASYPKTGHAPDYSWVAGQVVVTKIQGGCTFVQSGRESFAPNGQGWQQDQVKNGDYVVIFGHIAGQGEPVEICPGGKPYIVDKVMLNP